MADHCVLRRKDGDASNGSADTTVTLFADAWREEWPVGGKA